MYVYYTAAIFYPADDVNENEKQKTSLFYRGSEIIHHSPFF